MKKDDMTTIDPAHIRAGRALLNWTREDLSAKSGVGLRTLVRIEAGSVAPHRSTVERIKDALEQCGVRFRTTDDGEICVALRKDTSG